MKRFVVALLILVGVAVALAALVPVALSTKLVKQRIADQVAEWTGRRVTFTGNPRIALIPDLKISIDNVTIADPGGVKPLAAIATLAGKLRIGPLLAGRIEIVEFRLISPVIHLRRDRDGIANWNLRPLPDDDSNETWRKGPRLVLDLRRFRIRDGLIVYDDAASERHEEFSAASVLAQWPTADESATGIGTLVWRGERVEFNGSVGDPLALIEGKTSPARFALASTPIRAVFTGKATRLDVLQFEGATTLSTPSVRRLAAWLGAPTPESAVLGAGSIDGKVNWAGSSLSFSEAHMELDGNAADGSITAELAGGVPSIQGTLALQTLDISPYVEAYRAELATEGPWSEATIRLPGLSMANVDFRLSAEQLLVGSWRTGRVAIAAAVKGGQFTLNVGDARPYGGALAATAKGGMRNGLFVGSLEAKVTDMAAGIALRDLAGVSDLEGTGTLSLDLESRGQTWREVAAGLKGSGRLAIADASLGGFDAGRIAERLRGEDPGAEAGGAGSSGTFKATASLTIANGAVSTGDLHANGPGFEMNLSAETSLASGVLSGAGALTLTGRAPDQAVGFELSGTWDHPELYPDFGRIIRRSAAPGDAGREFAGSAP